MTLFLKLKDITKVIIKIHLIETKNTCWESEVRLGDCKVQLNPSFEHLLYAGSIVHQNLKETVVPVAHCTGATPPCSGTGSERASNTRQVLWDSWRVAALGDIPVRKTGLYHWRLQKVCESSYKNSHG